MPLPSHPCIVGVFLGPEHTLHAEMVFTQKYSSLPGSSVGARWLYSSTPRLLDRSTLSNQLYSTLKQSSLTSITSPNAKYCLHNHANTCLQSSAVFRNFERVGISSHREYITDRKFALPSMSTLRELLKTAKNKLLLTTSVHAAEPFVEVTPDKQQTSVTTTNATKKQTSSEGPRNVSKEDPTENDDVVVPAWFLGTKPVPETGWERLKDIFEVKEDKKLYYEKYSREVTDWINVMAAGFMIGFVYGGVPAARQARLRYIELSHTQVYQGRRDAVGDAHKAAHRGLIRYGYRWGWRVAVFAGIFHGVSTCLAIYRDKDDALNYTAAGALAGGLYKISLGLRGIIGGSFLGILLGVPTGLLTQLGQTLQGETYVERRRTLRKEILELRREEWKARLQLMDDFILETSPEHTPGTEPSTSGGAKQAAGIEPEPSVSGQEKVESDQPSGIEPSTSSQAKQPTTCNSGEQKNT